MVYVRIVAHVTVAAELKLRIEECGALTRWCLNETVTADVDEVAHGCRVLLLVELVARLELGRRNCLHRDRDVHRPRFSWYLGHLLHLGNKRHRCRRRANHLDINRLHLICRLRCA